MDDPAKIPEFGIKRENEERRDGGCAVVFDPKTQLYAVNKLLGQENGRFWLFSGGIEEGEDMQTGILREVVEESGLYDFLYVEEVGKVITHYHNTLKNVNRLAHATCFLIILKSTETKPTQLEEHEKFELVWATAEEVLKNLISFNENQNRDHWIYFFKKALNRAIELGYDTTSLKN